MKLRQFVLPAFFARLLSWVAYRKTDIPQETVGHKHRFFSFYLTKTLNLRNESGRVVKAADDRKLVLWIVPPGMFHEWVGTGTVWDITPLHRAHQLVV